jgi:hypothetical protein
LPWRAPRRQGRAMLRQLTRRRVHGRPLRRLHHRYNLGYCHALLGLCVMVEVAFEGSASVPLRIYMHGSLFDAINDQVLTV